MTYHLTTWHGWNRCTPAVLQGWLPNLILLMHPSFVHLPGTRVSVSKSRERVRDDDGGFQQPSSRSVVNRSSLEQTCCTLLAVLFANTSAVHEAGSALSICDCVSVSVLQRYSTGRSASISQASISLLMHSSPDLMSSFSNSARVPYGLQSAQKPVETPVLFRPQLTVAHQGFAQSDVVHVPEYFSTTPFEF